MIEVENPLVIRKSNSSIPFFRGEVEMTARRVLSSKPKPLLSYIPPGRAKTGTTDSTLTKITVLKLTF